MYNNLSEDTNNEMWNIQDLGKIDDIENPYNSQDDDSDANESSEWQDDYNPDLWEVNGDTILEEQDDTLTMHMPDSSYPELDVSAPPMGPIITGDKDNLSAAMAAGQDDVMNIESSAGADTIHTEESRHEPEIIPQREGLRT